MRSKKLRIIRNALLVVMALLGVFAVVVAFQPADYRVTRTARINATPAMVFGRVNDFHAWEAWSPWAKLDPSVKNTFDGPAAGTGAAYGWSGNDKVGEGHMTITNSHPFDLILIKLDFIRPFASTCATEFTFKPAGEQTEVTWTMTGKKNFVSKAFCMFMSMDKMVGGDFDRGLAKLKSESEAESARGK